MRPEWDDYFLSVAKAVSSRADCTRRRVGCVVVLDNRIISTGYNGAPASDPGCASAGACPRGQLSYEALPKDSSYHNCIAIHAEANALLYARTSCVGATAYVTDNPCPDCAKLLRGAGITRIVVCK